MNRSNEQPELSSLDGERGIPDVNSVHRNSPVEKIVVFIMFTIVIAFIAGLAYWKYQSHSEKVIEKPQRTMRTVKPSRTFDRLPPEPIPVETVKAKVNVPAPIVKQERKTTPKRLRAQQQYQAPILDKSSSPLMFNEKNGSRGGSKGSFSAQREENDRKIEASTKKKKGKRSSIGELSTLLTATKTSSGSASMFGNQNLMLAKGTFINCALGTKLDTTIPGMTLCTLTRDIYSENGNILLLERGSEVTGEYHGKVERGMSRIFVLWNRIKTPQGIIIDLDSPGTDPLGGSGLPGYIDTHFWERFGGAIMLSLIDDFARYATNETSNGDNTINFSSTSSATSDMATEALKNTINIPPTLYKNQGEMIGIFVARDLDFSEVYDVSAQ